MNTKMMLLLAVTLLPFSTIFAQVKIGGAPGAPVSSAVLELDGGGTKALRLPIVSSKEELGDFPNPVNGLLVYASYLSCLLLYADGWQELKPAGLNYPHKGTYISNADYVLSLSNEAANGHGIEGIALGTGHGMHARSTNGTSLRVTHNSNNGNSLVVENGRTGLGTLSPQARLHVNEGSAVFSAPGVPPGTPGPIPVTGSGRRMMWDVERAAFRVGVAQGDEWDVIGNYSFAAGRNPRAPANHAVAFGNVVSALGDNSIGLGSSSTANAQFSRVIGHNCQVGPDAIYASAIGFGAQANGDRSHAFGTSTTTNGSYSMALGSNTTAYSAYEYVIGHNNSQYTPASTTGWIATDRLFTIGNGFGIGNGRDALVLLKSGRMGLNKSDPKVDMHIRQVGGNNVGGLKLENSAAGWTISCQGNESGGNLHLYYNDGDLPIGSFSPVTGAYTQLSCRDLKTDIELLPDNTLSLVNRLTPVTYRYKVSDSQQKTMGFIAEDVAHLFPELVEKYGTGDNELSLNYAGFSVVAIKAIQEMELRLKSLEALVEKQHLMIEKLTGNK